MLRLAQKKYEDSDFAKVEGNKFRVIDSEVEPSFDLEAHLVEMGGPAKAVVGCVANNECLPFKDGTFDCYISSMSLMLVDNYRNQLAEALRVTQPGVKLGFTVWGRRENIRHFEVLDVVLHKHGLTPKEPPKKTPYDLGRDPEALKAEMETMGFKGIHMWYQAMNFSFRNSDDYICSIWDWIRMVRFAGQPLSSEVEEALKRDLAEEYK